MERMVGKMLRCFGRPLTLVRGELREQVWGMLESDTGRIDRLEKLHPSPLGLENRRRYIYIGPPQPQLQQGDRLTEEGRSYVVRTAQPIWGMEKIACIWAMCVEGGTEAWEKSGS